MTINKEIVEAGAQALEESLNGELITTEIEAFAAGMESRQDNEVQQ